MKVSTIEERRNTKRNMRLQKKLHCGRFERRVVHMRMSHGPQNLTEEQYDECMDIIFGANMTRDDGVFVGIAYDDRFSFDFAAGTLHDACWDDFIEEVREAFQQMLTVAVPDIVVTVDVDDEDHLVDAWYGY